MQTAQHPALQGGTAELQPAAFSASPADLQALLREPVCVPLTDFGVIAVRGADAATFLQTQLTSDVVGQGTDSLQLSGYCTPKGRVLATFYQWREAEEIRLALPREILAPVMKRLSMFVLRSKVVIADLGESCSIKAFLGRGADSVLAAAGFPLPKAVWDSVKANGVRISRLPGSSPSDARYLIATDPGVPWPASLADVRAVAPGVWWWSEVAAAVPTVFKRTQEKFVPQMINFEVLGGVNFKKGCYPGQEIVARSQYLGKLKRRMHLAHVDHDHRLAPGAEIYVSGDDTPVGTVVMAAAAPAGGVDLLFEAPADRLAGPALRAGSAAGPVMELRALPYQLFDPTA